MGVFLAPTICFLMVCLDLHPILSMLMPNGIIHSVFRLLVIFFAIHCKVYVHSIVDYCPHSDLRFYVFYF